MLASSSKRCIPDRTEPSDLYPALGNTLQASEADEAPPRNRTSLICRDGRTWSFEKSRASEYTHYNHNRPVYQDVEVHPALEEYSSYSDRYTLGVLRLRVRPPQCILADNEMQFVAQFLDTV